jgi:hypothetical protein
MQMERDPHTHHEMSGWQIALMVAIIALITILLFAFFLPGIRLAPSPSPSQQTPLPQFRQQQTPEQPGTGTPPPGIQQTPLQQPPAIFENKNENKNLENTPGRQEQERSGLPKQSPPSTSTPPLTP